MTRKTISKAFLYAELFALALLWILFLCLIDNESVVDIIVGTVMPIYMFAVILVLYPLFRYINRAFTLYPMILLLVCVLLGFPCFIIVGISCQHFGLGSGIAYIVYAYLLAIGLSVLCVADTLITFTVKRILKRRADKNTEQ